MNESGEIQEINMEPIHILSDEEYDELYDFFDFFFFQAEDGIRDGRVTGVQTCALPISKPSFASCRRSRIRRTIAVALAAVVVSTCLRRSRRSPPWTCSSSRRPA